MHRLIILSLLALMISTASASEKRGEKRYRKFRSFPPKDKRGTDYPSTIGHMPGLFQALSANTGHFARIPNAYVHQGIDHLNPGHSGFFTSNDRHGFKQNGLSIISLPASSPMVSASSPMISASPMKTGPITFALAPEKNVQGHKNSPFISMSSLGYNLPASPSMGQYPGSRALSGGLVFENPGTSYHVGLSSGSSDSSSYHIPISQGEYSEPAHQRHQFTNSYDQGYSLPSTNYGVPNGFSFSQSPGGSVSYATPSTSYAVSSEYPSDLQTSTAYGSRELQGAYSDVRAMFVNQAGKSQDDNQFQKYDTISYSSGHGNH